MYNVISMKILIFLAFVQCQSCYFAAPADVFSCVLCSNAYLLVFVAIIFHKCLGQSNKEQVVRTIPICICGFLIRSKELQVIDSTCLLTSLELGNKTRKPCFIPVSNASNSTSLESIMRAANSSVDRLVNFYTAVVFDSLALEEPWSNCSSSFSTPI